MMEDPRKDPDVLSSHSVTEAQFLKQVKECQHHLNCMEKLFFDLQKVNCEKEVKKSSTSLNNKLSKSFPDLQLLMNEYEAKINKKNELFKENSSESINEIKSILVEPVINAAPLTFVVQVPNTLVDAFKSKIPNNYLSDILSQASVKGTFGTTQRRGLFWFLQKLFKRKKHVPTIADVKISKDVLQFFKFQNVESTTSNFNTKAEIANKHTEKCPISANSNRIEMDDKSTDSKQSQNLVFPITYNFDGKTSTPILPNICIQHEIKPQVASNTFSHSIKIKNEVPTDYLHKSSNTSIREEEKKEIDDQMNKEMKSTEILIDNLIKTLLKTTEKLDNLELLKSLVEKMSEEKMKVKTLSQSCKSMKSKSNKKPNILNQLLRSKSNEDKSNKNKSPKKNEQKKQEMPKRQSSKLSICSNSNSVTSDEDIYKSSMTNSRLQHIQQSNRCQSPSTFNYLVCQSERDVDCKVNSFH